MQLLARGDVRLARQLDLSDERLLLLKSLPLPGANGTEGDGGEDEEGQ